MWGGNGRNKFIAEKIIYQPEAVVKGIIKYIHMGLQYFFELLGTYFFAISGVVETEDKE